MPFPRAILFVDGENLTARYQAMVNEGALPVAGVQHMPDVFVWHDRLLGGNLHEVFNVFRICYYTSVVGDETKVAEVNRELSKIQFTTPGADVRTKGQIVPVVFNKPAKSKKTRNVDIQIVIDIMRYAFTDEIDRVYLISGDGDYMPLIQEVMRRGKQVELLALSSGLNPKLPHSVDNFHLLDEVFFGK